MKYLISSLFIITLLFTYMGCGPKKVTLEDAETRIEALRSQGVPEGEMSKIKVYLYQMKSSKKSGNTGIFRKFQDSMDVALVALEERMGNSLAASKPIIDSLSKLAAERKTNLKGRHLKTADSMIVIADSLANNNMPLQAKAKWEHIALLMDTLDQLQKEADSLRSKFVGTWVIEQEAVDKRYNAVRRKEITFRKDGTLRVLESKHGQSDAYLKEAWKFISNGKWDLFGDLALMSIEKEKCTRQEFWKKTNSGKWKHDKLPTYDSTITDGRKDDAIYYKDLKEEYKWFSKTK